MSKLNRWKTSYAVALICTAGAVGLRAQTFTTLHSFDGTHGASPYAALLQADGNFYGTAAYGGADGAGTVFRITPSGALTSLYSFDFSTTHGQYPFAALVESTTRSLFGITQYGGAHGRGTVFSITPNGSLTTVYSFCSQSGCADGAEPFAGLIQAGDGNFYGTTVVGGTGTASACYEGCGTIFKITRFGELTTLHSFDFGDGQDPLGELIQGNDGNFYGTTIIGGAQDYGTVFKITPAGAFTSLYSFCSLSRCSDGENPYGALVQGTDGNLYGTTSAGGTQGHGTVFKITPSGTLTTIYSFCSQPGCADGSQPYGTLIQATDGNFYGTTNEGGPTNCYSEGVYVGCGTLFKITPAGVVTVLYTFCSQSSCSDGEFPYAPLTQHTNGNIYGTTIGGGANDYGTFFELSLGLRPFVKVEPALGLAGRDITILGTDLTGATSVTFNGTPAAFTVEASSVIKAAVPAGATTGTVQVVTPSGTLSSNVPFRVAP